MYRRQAQAPGGPCLSLCQFHYSFFNIQKIGYAHASCYLRDTSFIASHFYQCAARTHRRELHKYIPVLLLSALPSLVHILKRILGFLSACVTESAAAKLAQFVHPRVLPTHWEIELLPAFFTSATLGGPRHICSSGFGAIPRLPEVSSEAIKHPALLS
jgi:hypothetical protein